MNVKISVEITGYSDTDKQTDKQNISNRIFLSRTNVASVGSIFNDTRKVKVLSLPETMKEKSTF